MNFPRLVNTDLMAQPVNWITVPLMVAFGGLVLYLIDPLGVSRMRKGS